MAESVQFLLERMVPEFKDLEERGIFNKEEIKAVVNRRTDSEYKLRRRIARKADYLRYIQAEMNFERLRSRRTARLQIAPGGVSDHSVSQRIHFLFVRALRKFGGDTRLWLQHINYCTQTRSNTLLLRTLASAIQAHPLQPGFWILAAAQYFEQSNDVATARSLFHRALRLNRDSMDLWVEYARMELIYIERMKERRRLLGVTPVVEPSSASENIAVPRLPEEEESEAQGAHSEIEPLSTDFFAGAIPLAIFRNACEALPESLPLRQRFYDLASTFDAKSALTKAVKASIVKEYGADALTAPPAPVAPAARPQAAVVAAEPLPEGKAERRAYYERAVSKTPTNADLWLDAVVHELDSGDFDRANQLYWRALRSVSDAGAFMARYNALNN